MRYSLVLWDFDGTLVDTLAPAVTIYNDIALKHGYPLVEDLEELRTGSAIQFLRTHHIPLWRIPALRREFLSRQGKQLERIRLVLGLETELQQLHQQGVQLGIVSSNSEDNIRKCLANNSAESLFDILYGNARLTGKRRVLRRVIREARIEPTRVLYVGDEVARDIRAARGVGIDVAVVAWGFNSTSYLLKNDPTYLIQRPEDVQSIVAGTT